MAQTDTRIIIAVAGAGLALALPQAAAAADRGKTTVSPYIALDQTAVADLKGGDGDVLTYTTVTVGVDAGIVSQRAEATISAQYAYQKSWQRGESDSHIVSGIAMARLGIVRDALSIEGAALGTRVRSGGLTGANAVVLGDNGSSVYAGYLGPTLTTHAGALAINAAYRFGYARVSDDTDILVPGVAASPDRFSSSTSHYATASLGMKSGDFMPIGWTASAGWQREDGKVLDNRFDDKWARVDISVPVGPTIALLGGVGYQKIKVTQRDVVRDGAGQPVVGADGRYVTDDAAPRRLAYDQDGLIWDVGVMWRPSHRTSVTARVGRRYGSTSYTGSASWRPGGQTSFDLVVYDQIDGFGGLLNDNLANLPTSFTATRNPFSGDLTGCVQGSEGGGICLNSALAGLGSGYFRTRGVAAQLASASGPWSYGVAGGYSQRRFIGAAGTVLAAIAGRRDENYYGAAFLGRRLDDASSINFNIYGNYYDAGLGSSVDVLNAGGFAQYNRTLGRRLSASAALGVDGVDPDGFDSTVAALGQLGLRYAF